jgi:Transcriptional regulator, AbiEi antitoxin, Type IV TA system
VLQRFTNYAIFTATVNKANIVKIAGPLDGDAARILRDVPRVTVELTAAINGRPDVVIRAGDATHVVEVKSLRVANAAAAQQLAAYARVMPRGTHLLLVARTTTAAARQMLEDAGIGVIDTAGNIRIELPGLFLRTEGGHKAPPARDTAGGPPVKLTGKAGVAAQALLLDVGRQWQVRDLAGQAGVSAGLAHRVFTRLEHEHLVGVHGAGPQKTRRLTNPGALLDLWAEEVRDRGATQLHGFRLSRDPGAQARTLSSLLAESKIDHAITGAAAAAGLASFITAIPVTNIWISETVALDDVAVATGVEPVSEGHNVVLRQAADDTALVFRRQVENVWVANPFRVYFDLRQDPRRGREQADRLRVEVIGF